MIDTKKQAENAFGKGLVMDAHPMNSDNNTLSNCLNGTLITYNGNEQMLQNDMGNGRVETAFLPPGYVPVGMKEHGGIIYVASYNPITNHGQLGSFPSPERNISSDEMGNPSLMISDDTFKFNPITGVDTLYSKLSILDDNTIRPGDKFALYFTASNSDVSKLSDYITNYNNSTNKRLKLSVAVRDNNGNLQDITEDLKTMSNNYFMENKSGTDEDLTSLEGLRRVSEDENFNIYKGKLSGELYLIAELATITDYELSVSSNYEETDGKGLRTLKFKGTFNSEVNDIFKGVHISLDDGDSIVSGYVRGSNGNNHEVNITEVNPDAKLNYSITPILDYARLNSMTKSGILDMSLFGTGKIELNEWRYYNDLSNDTLSINWGIQAYLRNDDLTSENITDIAFNFFRFENNEFVYETSVSTKQRKNYSGNFIESISYEEVPHGQMYVVQIEIKVVYDGNERTEYFYKLLYTSEYFNQFYPDTSITDYQEKNIELTIKSDITLEEKNSSTKTGGITQSQTYTMNQAPNKDSYYDGTYPFYYLENQVTEKDFELNVKKYLSYDSYDAEHEQWDLPFVLNQEYVKTTTTISHSKATVSDVSSYGLFVKDDIKDGDEYYASESLADNDINYTNSLNNNLLNIKINTVAKYLAEQTSQQVNATSGTGFRGYMCEENLLSIFGYNPIEEGVTQPKYGLNMRVGRDNSKGRLAAGVCEYSGSSYTQSAKGTLLDKLETYRTDRRWKTQICPALINSLQKSLRTSPNIFFIIGGETDKWSHCSDGNSNLMGRNRTYTIDYNIVLWKGYNDDTNYYMLNQYFTKEGSTTNGLASLISIFKHIYTKQDFVNSGTMFKSGTYSYTQDYNVNYEGTLQTSHTTVEDKSELVTGDNIVLNFENALNSLYGQLGSAITESQLNDLKNAGNLTIKIELPEKEEHQVAMSASVPSIDSTVMRYTEASGAMAEGALKVETGGLLETDYKGNPFQDTEMYYVGGDGLAYPLSKIDGLSNSELEKLGVDRDCLNSIYKGFRMQYDPVTKMYQLRVNPSGVRCFTLNVDDYPRISSDNRAFYPAHAENGQGCLLDIKLTTKNAKYLR